ELAVTVVGAGEAFLDLAEERGESLEVRLLPTLERMIVALRTIESNAEEGARHARRQTLGIGLILVRLFDGHGDEVCRRLVGPQALGCDQIAHKLVIGAIAREFLGEPRHKTAAAIHKKRPILRADESAGEALREIIRRAAIAQDAFEPPLQAMCSLM